MTTSLLPLARHGHRAHIAEAPQAVIVLARVAPADHFQASRADSHSGSSSRICGLTTPRSESPNPSCAPGGRIRRGQAESAAQSDRRGKCGSASAGTRKSAENPGAAARRAKAATRASCGSRARTSTFKAAPCSSSRLAATCAPMYPVDPVRNIATLLRWSRSSRHRRSRARVESCAEAALPAAALQSEDKSSGAAQEYEC